MNTKCNKDLQPLYLTIESVWKCAKRGTIGINMTYNMEHQTTGTYTLDI